MLGNSKIDYGMEKENLPKKMVVYIMENGKIANQTDMGSTCFLMEGFTKEIGKMGNTMVMEIIHGQMGHVIKVNF